MTIKEYYERVAEIEKLSSVELVFLRNICKSVGHQVFKDANRFGDVCTRCGTYKSWMPVGDLEN